MGRFAQESYTSSFAMRSSTRLRHTKSPVSPRWPAIHEDLTDGKSIAYRSVNARLTALSRVESPSCACRKISGRQVGPPGTDSSCRTCRQAPPFSELGEQSTSQSRQSGLIERSNGQNNVSLGCLAGSIAGNGRVSECAAIEWLEDE
jgi:hypothetical protein